MSDTEKANTLLVINLESLISGDRLYFNASNQPAAIAAKDKALTLARHYGITAATVKISRLLRVGMRKMFSMRLEYRCYP